MPNKLYIQIQVEQEMNKSYAMAVKEEVKALKVDTSKPPKGFEEVVEKRVDRKAGYKRMILQSNTSNDEKIIQILKQYLKNKKKNMHCTIMERRMQLLLKAFINLLVDYDDMINLKMT